MKLYAIDSSVSVQGQKKNRRVHAQELCDHRNHDADVAQQLFYLFLFKYC